MSAIKKNEAKIEELQKEVNKLKEIKNEDF